jgi:hypothetical protein
MAQSARLSQLDIRAVFHLVAEIVERGRDPNEWRVHVLKVLSPLVGARAGIAREHYINPDAILRCH